MKFENADFSHLNEPDETSTRFDLNGMTVSDGERREFGASQFERDVADFIRFGQIKLDDELRNVGHGGLERGSNVPKSPYYEDFNLLEMLREYGIVTCFSDDAAEPDGERVPHRLSTWHDPNQLDILEKVRAVFYENIFLGSFITEMTIGLIRSDNVDESGRILEATLSHGSLSEQEKKEMIKQGFMTALIQRFLDFSEPDGRFKFSDASDESLRHEVAAYEALAKKGYRPFSGEQLLGMMQAEFEEVLNANPELKVELETYRRTGGIKNKPKKLGLGDNDYRLDF